MRYHPLSCYDLAMPYPVFAYALLSHVRYWPTPPDNAMSGTAYTTRPPCLVLSSRDIRFWS
eukprot:3326090-Rhodomonas_salina.1